MTRRTLEKTTPQRSNIMARQRRDKPTHAPTRRTGLAKTVAAATPIATAEADSDGDYLLMSLRSEKALRRASALLRSISTADGDEERLISVAIASLDADIAEVIAEREAFLAEKTAIASPTASQVEEIANIAKELDRMTANARQAKSIIVAATKLFQTWSDRPRNPS
jgi:hypothetical protein